MRTPSPTGSSKSQSRQAVPKPFNLKLGYRKYQGGDKSGRAGSGTRIRVEQFQPYRGPDYAIGYVLPTQVNFYDEKTNLLNPERHMVELYIDSGSFFTWIQEKDEPKMGYNDVMYEVETSYRDKAVARARIILCQMQLTIQGQAEPLKIKYKVGLGSLYRQQHEDQPTDSGDSIPPRESRSMAKEKARTAIPQVPKYIATREMKGGMVGLAREQFGYMTSIKDQELADFDSLMKIIAAEYEMPPVVSYFLTPHSKSAEAECTFGGIDEIKVVGELVECKIVKGKESCQWSINSKLRYGASTENVRCGETYTVFDTGCPYLSLPTKFLDLYLSAIGAKHEENMDYYYLEGDDEFKRLQSLYLIIGGKEFEYIPDAQVYHTKYNEDNGISLSHYVLSIHDGVDHIIYGLPVRE